MTKHTLTKKQIKEKLRTYKLSALENKTLWALSHKYQQYNKWGRRLKKFSTIK